MKNLFTSALLLIAFTWLNAQPRSVNERLIGHYGELFDQGLWYAKDSDNYSYTGTRGAADFVDAVCDVRNQLTNTNNNGLENYKRVTNTFDANNNRLTNLTETWDNGSWINGDKFVMTYTPQGFEESYTRQLWQNGWKNQNGEIKTFDANGNVITRIARTWVNNAWVNDSRNTYTYDTDNRQLTDLKELWTNNAWVEDSKTTNTYNGLGKITEVVLQENGGAGLENKKRTTSLYNANNKLYQRTDEVWVLNSTWLNSVQVVYTFDVQGNFASFTYYEWSSGANLWVGNFRYVYAYDVNNNKTLDLTQRWTNGAWINDFQGLYTYNNANRYTNILTQKWINGAWQNNTKLDYTYDNSGNITFSETQDWAINSWAGNYKYVKTYTALNHLASQLNTKWMNGAYVDYTRDFYYYENFENGLTGINETKFAQTKLYPNPSGGIVNVEFAATGEEPVTMNIYTIAGDLIATQKAQSIHGDNRFTFNTQNMPKGFYTVQLKAATAESNLKLVVN